MTSNRKRSEQNIREQQSHVWITIGVITAPHGVRGEVRVMPTTDFPERFQNMKHVSIVLGEERHEYEVIQSRFSSRGMILLTLRDVTSRDEAEKLRDAPIQVRENETVPLPDDHFYVHDLVGCDVFTTDGERLGTFHDVYVTGANDVYSVRSEEGKELLIPALKSVVQSIDIKQRRIVVDPLPGLFD